MYFLIDREYPAAIQRFSFRTVCVCVSECGARSVTEAEFISIWTGEAEDGEGGRKEERF